MLVRHLARSPVALTDTMRRAGETRSIEELCDPGSWSTYEQFRALAEAAEHVLGGEEALVAVGADAVSKPTMPEIHALMLSLGSPDALFEEIVRAGGASLVPISDTSGEPVGPNEWLIRQRFRAGYPAFRAYCAFARGLFHSVPRLFGLAAEVEEEACECDGAPRCVFRVRWDTTGEGASTEFYEAHIMVLQAQLQALQTTVGDLVSGESLTPVLGRIVEAAARTVNAPWFVLALESATSTARRVYARGLPQEQADEIACELMTAVIDENDLSRLVVDVASTQCHYGRLAAINPGGRFFPQQLSALQAYARLAAAALDSATALEESRRQASTARVLLELSASLAEIRSPDEMASTLAHAIPAIIDCDRAFVLLRGDDEVTAHVVSSCGYEQDVAEWLMALELPLVNVSDDAVVFYDRDSGIEGGLLHRLMDRTDAILFASVPIIVDGETSGFVVADVCERPERLLHDDQLHERLSGLAGQGATAVRNARLLDQVRHQALHDTLTDLPNRGLIFDRIDGMLARARRTGMPCAALFIDLDGFKEVNDALGHDAGDELLRHIAQRLSGMLRESDSLGRLGGDEFVVLVEGTSLDAGPEFVAHRILEVLRLPVVLDSANGKAVRITGSVGIATGTRTSATQLLSDADLALYEAKAEGKDRYVVFEPAMHHAAQQRRALEFDIRIALERDEFTLAYQPIVNLRDGVVTGLEALLRWHHPQRGDVEPDVYIPMLEASGQIVEVGRWVLDEACRQMVEWRSRGHLLDVSVNVSAVQLDTSTFVDDVRACLTRTGLDPTALILEITETAVMRDTAAATARLTELKELGVRVAIDDFGTGWSSLAILQQLPIDLLKIDRSFIEGLDDEGNEADPVIDALLRLGKTMGLATLAEGIEELRQFDRLQRADCDSGQGFLFARPLDPASVEQFLMARRGGSGAQAGVGVART